MIHEVGNVELCELLETEHKTQCTVCLSYWISVYSAARAGISCIKKEGPIKNSSIIRWTFFQSLSTSSRREDLMDIDMVKSRTDSYETKNSVIEWLKILETKIFVDDGMLLRMKITLTIWPHKNTSTIRANGDFIQISKVLILCHWDIDLISSRHCLLCNDCNKKQEKNHRCLLTFTNTNNGRHAVHLLHGGIGKVHSGLLIIPKVIFSERSDLLVAVLGKILRKKTFMNSMYFVTDWSFTADVGPL